MWLSRYFVIFVLFSFVGWVYETIYCTIKWKRWENRGFLFGPICPIYGTGATSILILMEVLDKYNVTYTWWQVFIVCYLGSVVLEYTTHWALEKMFHACWWDYSYMPLNIKGRVCVPYSICFGLAGILVRYALAPFAVRCTAWIPPIGFEFAALLFMLIVGMDISLTAVALSEFEKYVTSAQESLNAHMEQFVENVGDKYGQMSDQMSAKIAEEKEKFSRERISAKIQGMSAMSKHAVKRIVTYRPAIGEKIAHNRILEFMKEHKPELKSTRESE